MLTDGTKIASYDPATQAGAPRRTSSYLSRTGVLPVARDAGAGRLWANDPARALALLEPILARRESDATKASAVTPAVKLTRRGAGDEEGLVGGRQEPRDEPPQGAGLRQGGAAGGARPWPR